MEEKGIEGERRWEMNTGKRRRKFEGCEVGKKERGWREKRKKMENKIVECRGEKMKWE